MNKKTDKKNNSEIDIQDRFIQEVSEELKSDQLTLFWKKYGIYVTIVVAAILTLTIGFESFKKIGHANNQEYSDKYAYATALQFQGNYNESLEILEDLSKSSHKGYSSIAKLQIVNLYIDRGDKEAAINKLEEIVSDKKMNEKFKNVAIINLASYKIDSNASIEEIEELVSPLIKKDSTWSNLAKEKIAFTNIRDKNFDAAKTIFSEILASPYLSQELKQRANDTISIISDEE